MKRTSKLFGKLKEKPEGGSKGRTGAEIGAEAGTVTKSSQATTPTTLASSEQTPASDSAKVNISFITPQPPSASPPPAQPAARSTSFETAASSTDINITSLPRFDHGPTSSIFTSSKSSAS